MPPKSRKYTRIDKSLLPYGIEQRYEDRAYLDALHSMECVVTGYRMTEGSEWGVDPAHLRLNFHAAGMKPHDIHVLPLDHREHAKQVNGELHYWVATVERNPMVLIRALKGWATLRYIKWMLGEPEMSDLVLVRKIREMRK